MELSWWVYALVTGVCFLLGFTVGGRPWRKVKTWHRRRWIIRNAPPVGSRPEVQVIIDGVSYEVTDTLIRLRAAPGRARWAIVGPAHVRVQGGQSGIVQVSAPPPLSTTVEMLLIGEPNGGRFMTVQEIKERFELHE
jgi:hypothetical protein